MDTSDLIKNVIVPIAVALIGAFGAGIFSVIKIKDKKIQAAALGTIIIVFSFITVFVVVASGLLIEIFSPSHAKVDIVVVNFDTSDSEHYHIAQFIKSQLDILQKSPHAIEIGNESIKVINGRDAAIALGYEWNAKVVIWGWYATADEFYLQSNLEIVNYIAKEPKINPTIQVVTQADSKLLGDFALQKQLGHDISDVAYGLYCYSLERWDCAIENFSTAIENKENNIFSYSNPSVIYQYRGGAYYFDKKYELAILDFEEVLNAGNKGPLEYYLLGRAQEMNNNLLSAYKYYSDSINLYGYPDAYVRRAMVYAINKDYEKAIEDYENAIKGDSHRKYNPGDADSEKIILNSYLQDGIALLDKEDYVTALDRFDRAIGMDYEYYDAYYYRGIAHMNLEYVDEAIADFTKYKDHGSDKDLVKMAKEYKKELNWKKFLPSINKE